MKERERIRKKKRGKLNKKRKTEEIAERNSKTQKGKREGEREKEGRGGGRRNTEERGIRNARREMGKKYFGFVVYKASASFSTT